MTRQNGNRENKPLTTELVKKKTTNQTKVLTNACHDLFILCDIKRK